VIPDREAKCISHETTFAADIAEMELLRAWLIELTEQVARRLRRHRLKGKTVDIKVRFSDFRTITRAMTLPAPTNITDELLQAGLQLLETKLPAQHLPVRLLGFGVSGLDGSALAQRQLFDEPQRQKQQALDQVADSIAAKFGKTALRRAGGARQSEQ
jgi:DNA polymerase-4